MDRFVFFSATKGRVEVFIEDDSIGKADNSVSLSEILRANNITWQDTLAKSSSIDFCEEYGFEEGGADVIIDEALATL